MALWTKQEQGGAPGTVEKGHIPQEVPASAGSGDTSGDKTKETDERYRLLTDDNIAQELKVQLLTKMTTDYITNDKFEELRGASDAVGNWKSAEVLKNFNLDEKKIEDIRLAYNVLIESQVPRNEALKQAVEASRIWENYSKAASEARLGAPFARADMFMKNKGAEGVLAELKTGNKDALLALLLHGMKSEWTKGTQFTDVKQEDLLKIADALSSEEISSISTGDMRGAFNNVLDRAKYNTEAKQYLGRAAA
ncbi:TPA: hypothetical protein DCZ32_03590 [Candidatus Uhrbacteria bacterium]|nr:hypothetical protein [Candidatus Uhrbacteria bacterium]